VQYDQFVGEVQHRARLASRADAEKAIRATLETLGERLEEGLAGNIAAQLPDEIARHLHGMPADLVDKMDLDEFLERVSDSESVDLPVSVHHARCVLEVLGEAVGSGPMEKLRLALPAEYERLLVAGSTGSMGGGA
jgi:uncharacterized protein (DUF2267 family)